MKKIGVILSGCGVRDGSEIHEAVLTLLAIDNNGAKAVCLAPDIELDEVNHLTMQDTGAKRKVLVEAARIARGEIADVKSARAEELDAIVLPGGFGAAKNLCSFAFEGAKGSVQPDVLKLIRDMAAAKKPICAICIAPAVIALALGKDLAPKLTIGNDTGTAQAINATGSSHVECPATECVVDRDNLIVSTPAYMLAGGIAEAAKGIEKAIKATLELIR
ncbi:isoprenoid biosynthesis glyoxalase ElbB [Geomonas sp. Red69]|uniref:Isoprenoid biosynthesis glyoxalase ElbB n=1 Tax=Geomonas diazotrophica TaxID=2843197 RepID=A0ABX8JHZ7_9BACT|nr:MULTISPECIES: isoprenoid biosynthesis glyoxalase ElbB [Geomonas]MBU5635761.1 isoprenoid biosynthesis glyoxalase ElbB [Geomonas diazotrophica]QWV98003.1 isoprenoid biosynthesis glyoxalase ElbB [Geomonas nitrogeniifigens]QXE87134.1 isoprenoid biosynthesis glyoxalase ElbB [Geomonas nitrogeniifigens]